MTSPGTEPTNKATQAPRQIDPLLRQVAEALLDEHQPGTYGFCTAGTCHGGVWPCPPSELAGGALGRTLLPSQRPVMKQNTK